MIVHIYNPSYSGGRSRKIWSLTLPQQKLMRPSLRNKKYSSTAKRKKQTEREGVRKGVRKRERETTQ
jgi:hypothetical protein